MYIYLNSNNNNKMSSSPITTFFFLYKFLCILSNFLCSTSTNIPYLKSQHLWIWRASLFLLPTLVSICYEKLWTHSLRWAFLAWSLMARAVWLRLENISRMSWFCHFEFFHTLRSLISRVVILTPFINVTFTESQ